MVCAFIKREKRTLKSPVFHRFLKSLEEIKHPSHYPGAPIPIYIFDSTHI